VAAYNPVTSEYSCLASAKLKESSLASVTFSREMSVQFSRWPKLYLPQIPSNLWGIEGPREGSRAHAFSSLAPKPCSPCRHQLIFSCRICVFSFFCTLDTHVMLFALNCHPRHVFESKVCHIQHMSRLPCFENMQVKTEKFHLCVDGPKIKKDDISQPLILLDYYCQPLIR